MGFLFAQMAADPLSGGAGWVGAGLLGCCLAWLFFVHIPAKDRQLRDLLLDQTKERDKERTARHSMLDSFQQTMSEVEKEHRVDMERQNCQHLTDADRDRQAFVERNNAVIMAIQAQTTEFKLVAQAMCRFVPCQFHQPDKS
jgi:Tfp pilus assembly protein PilN